MADHAWVHPRFDRPPIIETAFSIEFTPLARWQIPFFGLYWATIRDRYPKLNVHSPLHSQIEDLDGVPAPKNLMLDFRTEPEARCWFYNETETQLIQVQKNRFIF